MSDLSAIPNLAGQPVVVTLLVAAVVVLWRSYKESQEKRFQEGRERENIAVIALQAVTTSIEKSNANEQATSAGLRQILITLEKRHETQS